MIKNPLLWAAIMAIIFLAFKREEILKPVAPSPTPNKTETLTPSAAVKPVTTQSTVDGELMQDIVQTEQTLPRIEDLSELSEEEAHERQAANNRLGKTIGQVAEKGKALAARRAPTIEFFLRCAEDSKIAEAARALCWWKLTNKINEWKVFIPLADAKVPMDVQRLAASMNP